MKILVLGVAGMFGHMACRTLGPGHDVYGTCRGAYGSVPLETFVPRERCFDRVDAGDGGRLTEVFDTVGPEVVLNCIGVIKQKPAARDAVTQIRINSLFPHEVAVLAERVGAKLIQLGTDCVFSGRRGMYRPDDLPDPVDLYGRTKLVGEVTHRPHLTLRTSIVGRQLGGSQSLFEWFMAQRGGKVGGFVHAIYSGLTTGALATVIGELLERRPDLSGLYHVASSPISKYDLLATLNDKLGLDVEIVPETGVRCDRSLDGSAFRDATGIEVPSWEEMLDRFAEDSPRYETWRSAV